MSEKAKQIDPRRKALARAENNLLTALAWVRDAQKGDAVNVGSVRDCLDETLREIQEAERYD